MMTAMIFFAFNLGVIYNVVQSHSMDSDRAEKDLEIIEKYL